jgi:hypothetical protein
MRVLVALLLVAVPCWAQPVAPDSPLATDGERLFAVAQDRRTVISRPIGSSGSWEPVPHDKEFGRPAGLAVSGGALYVADAERSAVFRLPVAGGPVSVVVEHGGIKEPGALVAAARQPDRGVEILYVADAASGRIYRVWVDDGHTKYAPLEIPQSFSGGAMLASWRDALVVSDADKDLLIRIGDAPYNPWLSDVLQSTRPDEGKPRGSSSVPRVMYQGRTPNNDGYPRIEHPGAIATREGVIYAVSESLREVFSTPRSERRPVRSSFSKPPVARPSRIVITEQSMFVLDAEHGDVVQWPRPVPTEFTFDVEATSTCMARFYRYLRDRAALPTRTVPLAESLEKTLRREGALRSPWVAAFDELICGLNPKLCTNGRVKSKLPAGQQIRIPDLLIEGKLVTRQVTLDRKTTVREYVAKSVTSEEFAGARDNEYVSQFNRAAAKKAEAAGRKLLDERDGEFFLPRELVRYVAAVPEPDVHDGMLGEALENLKRQCPGTQINPLESRYALKSQANPPNWDSVDSAYDHMTTDVIHFKPALTTALPDTPFIGIVEAAIDFQHPDFFDANGAAAFVTDPPPKPAISTAAGFTVRPGADGDHGTAVAYLVGGRRRRTQDNKIAGLAPITRLVPFQDELSSLPDRFTGSDYYPQIRVVNMSLRTPLSTSDPGIIGLMNDNQQVLFVVAAGNNDLVNKDQELCNGVAVFPACEHWRKNVLVVGATTADGATMLAPSATDQGSHWSPKNVHVVAPGEGFDSAGNDSAYVAVRGTSFAAPLVTATAALLVAQGIDTPWTIKQRIIAAADPVDSLKGRTLGGLLNVERTLSDAQHAVLVDGNGTRLVVEAVTNNRDLKMRFGTKPARPVPFADVLRLTSTGGPNWRLVYRPTPDTIDVQDGVRAPDTDTWMISYFNLDSHGHASGQRVNERLDRFTDYIATAPK